MSIEDARKARAAQSLLKNIRLDSGEVLTIKDFLDRLHRQGGVLTTSVERMYATEDKLRAQVERMAHTVPMGNPYHPAYVEWYALKEKLQKGIVKESTHVSLPSGVRYELRTKAEIYYFDQISKPEE